MPIKLKKGLNLQIAGAAEAKISGEIAVSHCAIAPDDYPGFQARPALKEGEHLDVGDPVAYDKLHPALKLVSPVSGTLKSIVRGERRKILNFVIESDNAGTVRKHATETGNGCGAVIGMLAESGLLALMRTRPYDIVPDPEAVPRDIFVSCIDSAPLAVSAVALAGKDAADKIRSAVKLLGAATAGKVYLCVDSEWPYGRIEGAETITFEGRHPVGNASVQIEAVAPVNKGDMVWTLGFDTLLRIGYFAITGTFDPVACVAVTGPEVKNPGVLRTVIGAPVEALVKGNLMPSDHHQRIISGTVLTGEKVGTDGYLHYPYRQITVIAEGDDKDEFLGWASLSPSKMSASKTFPGHFLKRLFKPDARIQGGRRAMIMSGQYDKTIPMDIMPEYLIKAIMGRDIEAMEKLGIYEVAPEDFALAEYADTSKLPLQKIVREGLDYIRKELQ
ncbi:MAG: NADH:ubiquinone reductase (Na(+)-transporting) subunit A [Muribaculaceae bacterium]|nr:NADH:ubiquinone reductase (Na(+)-transporting) subunit A [Muribaculaceae bacterium]